MNVGKSGQVPARKAGRRRLAAGLCGAVGLGVLFGATGAWAQAAPPARTTLVVAAYPAVDEIVRKALPAWQRRHPTVDVKVVSRAFADHHTAMTTALSTAFYLPDVMALEVGYVGRFAQGGGLEDLREQPYDIQRFQQRWVPYALAQATSRKGRIVAVPSDIGPGTMLYRQDILSKAGLTEADLTATWEGYVQSGVQIKARTGAYLMAHARDLKDILIRVGIAQGDGLYFDANNKVLVNSPRFVRAFELARKVRQNKLDARVGTWSNEWSEGFKRGSLATQISGAWLAGHLNNWLAPATKGLWRAAPLPQGAFAAYGGTFFAIARGAPAANKALAWDLIQHLTLQRDQQLAAFKAHDAFPALTEALNDPFFEEPLPFLGGQKARLQWRDATQRITAVSVHKQDAFADEVINTELDKVLDQGKDIATALADAERLLQRRANR
ncbi:ABC transporter substrate-binding protein [Ideonella paludis]|uniref:Extracellular solute-binding protein n=1 Tax=Ideonella paludis TaxID=1233411 RepID=A0ABS5DXZ0_9BURK|nr:extracellular solute-binding protein [Ideonella paludis]MBQ0936015.1 extracellular solute-binding protein [Ideonella paludis]